MNNQRCPEGHQLYQEWTRQLELHDRDFIYDAMRAYFRHKAVCYECSSVRVIEQNRELTPSLFVKDVVK